ncbi:MAG: YceI family protein [Flavobacteriales bacterium]|nr:YceI family protein [Flavobacteriales bacterium]MBP9080190.1 YceI family protein [Flavobacteriales bacterium]
MIKAVALVLSICCSLAALSQSDHRIDPAATKLEWTGKKVTGQHRGSIDVQQGRVQWGANGLVQAEVVIDMTTIKALDMDASGATRLEGHLRSDDFFHTGRYKTASFRTTKVERLGAARAGQPNYTVTGDLTIKGITRPVTFKLRAWQEKHAVRAVGTAVFDRTRYGIEYRSGSFFDALGDKMIDDLVELRFDLEAR